MHLLKLNFICPTLGVHFTFRVTVFLQLRPDLFSLGLQRMLNVDCLEDKTYQSSRKASTCNK